MALPAFGTAPWWGLCALRRRRLARKFPDGKVSAHFRYQEFQTKDGTPIPLRAVPGLQRLCREQLEPMRARFGTVHVLSGYRHRKYNKSIGGASQSYHIWDEHPLEPAADLVFASGSPGEWAAYARKLRGTGGGGVGLYPTSGFVHVDVRRSKADWSGR